MTILHFSRAFELSQRLEAVEPLERCDWPACGGACCLHGVWLDPFEAQDLRAHADLIAPWMLADRRDPAQWFTSEREAEPGMPSGEVIAALVVPNSAHYGGQECIFLRPDSKCALQVAGEAAGLDPWRLKPFHCILHPLTFDEAGLVSLAPLAELHDEPASCLRRAAEPRPLRVLFESEIEYLTHVAEG